MKQQTAQRTTRQFLSDYINADPSAGITLTGTLHDNTTAELQDNDTAGTPIIKCP